MKIKFAHASRGNRVNYGFDINYCFAGYVFVVGCTNYDGYWWSSELNKWVVRAEGEGLTLTSYFPKPIKSMRAFRRRLRQWKKNLPKSVEFFLYHNDRYYDITGKT